MSIFRNIVGTAILLCIGHNAYAQYDYSDGVDEWTLDYEEEEAPKPQHKEYKNMLYLQYGYSPSDYMTEGTPHLHFNEISLGYARSVRVMEDVPFFVEAGLNAKASYSIGNASCDYSAFSLLTLRIPVNVTYKFYLYKERDIAIAPFAGANARLIALGKEFRGSETLDLFNSPQASIQPWKRLQIGWQVGLKFFMDRVFIGASYSRDFRDDTKMPHVYETSAHIGVCF